MAFRQIAKVAEAELSVTCTDKLIGPEDELSTCICFTKHLAPMVMLEYLWYLWLLNLFLRFYIELS